jgi:hypothetical protein
VDDILVIGLSFNYKQKAADFADATDHFYNNVFGLGEVPFTKPC